MPTLTELKHAVEGALDDPGLKAEIYARPLRTAGLLTTGGRGPSTPQVTPRDCANLMIAILGDAPAIKGPETVERYRSLVLTHRRPGPRGRRSTRPERIGNLEDVPISKIESVHYFGDLIELLIRWAADDSLRSILSAPIDPLYDQQLLLRLIGPQPAAVLRCHIRGRDRYFAYTSENGASSKPKSGFARIAEINENVLYAIGSLFEKGGRNVATRLA